MSWQAAVIKFQCISVNVTYLFSFLHAVTSSWLAWPWELVFKVPPCESCQLIYLFLFSGSSHCVIQKLLKERCWVNLWFSSFESTLEVLLHILPSCGSYFWGVMRLIWSLFLRNQQCFCWKRPSAGRSMSFLWQFLFVLFLISVSEAEVQEKRRAAVVWDVEMSWQEDHSYFILIPTLLWMGGGHCSKLCSPNGHSVFQSPSTLQMVASIVSPCNRKSNSAGDSALLASGVIPLEWIVLDEVVRLIAVGSLQPTFALWKSCSCCVYTGICTQSAAWAWAGRQWQQRM